MNNERKKRIVIRTGNGDTFRFRRNADFYISYERHAQTQTLKVPIFLHYCMYLSC